MAIPAIFLDRDGVIIENCTNYVRSWDDVEFFEDSLQTLTNYSDLPFLFILVTNQSVIGRGLEPFEKINGINSRIMQVIKEHGGRVDGVYICPHSPDDDCDCRKPNPGLLLQAAKEMDIDISNSIMVGDALTDLAAGEAAGVKQTILLKTGRGEAQSMLPEFSQYKSSLIYNNLAEAFEKYIHTQSSVDTA